MCPAKSSVRWVNKTGKSPIYYKITERNAKFTKCRDFLSFDFTLINQFSQLNVELYQLNIVCILRETGWQAPIFCRQDKSQLCTGVAAYKPDGFRCRQKFNIAPF